jgi:hypothetical protein
MITLASGHTITMSCSQARKQWFQLLGMIDEAGLVVLLTHRRQLRFALLPFTAALGRVSPSPSVADLSRPSLASRMTPVSGAP